jgi:hypothetical protein
MSDLPSIPQATLDRLLQEGDDAWLEFRARPEGGFHRFVPSDYLGAYEELKPLRSRAETFVELGSGLGIVTILADLLGFEAYGIEIEPRLVERSIQIAERFGSAATFAEGSFVAPDYRDEVEHLSADFLTPTDGAYAFDELGLELSDFDLVFAYPWPGEEDWLLELIRRHARASTLLLTYNSDGGFQLTQGS